MLRIKEDKNHGLKAPLFASLSLAFASFGDAFLYPFLPVNHLAVGLPVAWVGVLLSVNRFVRIFANTWIVKLLARYGLRVITVAAATIALLSTAGYAFASGLWLWLLLRIGWGLAFSALRLSTIGYSLQQSQQGFALGFTRGIQEAGPMSVLFLSPLLLHYFSATDMFIALAVLSLPSIYFAWNLPTVNDKTTPMVNYSLLQIPSLVNVITFISAFMIEGVIVVALGILFLNHNENITLMTATLMAAFYLGYRRVCLVLFSPLSGWIADRIGLNIIFNVSLFMMLVGLFVLALGWIEIGAILTFTFYSIHAAVVPGYVSAQHDHPLASVAENATWRDMGAALGTLAGGLLLSSNYLNYVFNIVVFSLALLFLFQMGTVQRAFKFLYLWK